MGLEKIGFQGDGAVVGQDGVVHPPRMAQDGAVKVLQGVTSLDELGRVVDLHDEAMLETIA